MVNLEGAGIKRPPPVAQDAFERVKQHQEFGKTNILDIQFQFFQQKFQQFFYTGAYHCL